VFTLLPLKPLQLRSICLFKLHGRENVFPQALHTGRAISIPNLKASAGW
jgi:hypothetical protein